MTDIQIPDELHGLVKIGARLDALAGLMNEASEGLPDRVSVEDSTGMLELTMLRDGTIEDFQMESDWKDEIDPEDLGDAVTALLGDARVELMESIEEAVSEEYEELLDDDESFNILTDSFAEKIRNEVAAARDRSYGSVVSLQQALDDADSFMDRAHAALNDPVLLGVDDEVNLSESVACSRVGGKPISIRVNSSWARTTPYAAVQAGIREELTAEIDDYAADLVQELTSQGDTVFEQLIAAMRNSRN